MQNFIPVQRARLSVGLVLRTSDERYLRITHVFGTCAFAIQVGEPSQARDARRPFELSKTQLDAIAESPGATWGKLSLPDRFTSPPAAGSDAESSLHSKWELIHPLVAALEKKQNLGRTQYEAHIRQRATETSTPFMTLKRLLHRYYYFGRTTYALVDLPRGVQPGSNDYSKLFTDIAKGKSNRPKRRGPKSVLTQELGDNDYIVTEADVDDMLAELKRLLRRGPTNKSHAHEEYLAHRFSKRHPEIYEQYMQGLRQVPITRRQFNYYLSKTAPFDDELSANLREHTRNKGSLGSLYASGPGEVYEIDATGGRIHLVTSGAAPVLVGKPTIYLMVDRWSRFVVSAYMSLQPPSYQELSASLLIAFTSRERRFRALGVNVDDELWPVGCVPPVICHDRGSEFVSDSMRQALAKDLGVELTCLPPYCPDGKAIVERLIRELKRRMAASGMKGVYADRPLDPKTKKVARKAEAAAVQTLAEAYRVLIEIIVDHNNHPHSALRRKKILSQADIEPTPQAAYQWGLKNLTGLRVAPFSDEEYKRMLLAIDTASIASGVLRYKGRPYLPLNEAAIELAKRSPKRASKLNIRVDKSEPQEIFIVTTQGHWASFGLTKGAEDDIATLSLGEEAAFSEQNALLWARSEHASRVDRVRTMGSRKPAIKRPKAIKEDKSQQLSARSLETAKLKDQIVRGLHEAEVTTNRPPAGKPEWMRLEDEERQKSLAIVRQHRKRN